MRFTSPVDAWFATFEAAGEDIFIRFGRLPSPASAPEWIVTSHIGTDGIGAFGTHLRMAGYAGVERLPRMRNADKPSAARVVRRVVELLGQKDGGPYAVLSPRARREGAAVPPMSATLAAPTAPTALGWWVFDEAATKQLMASAEQKGVTLNSLLLAALDEACRAEARPSDGCTRWVIPVNMRGGIELPADSANYVSSIEVALSANDAASEVHAKIRSCLTQLDHWAIWYGYAVAARAGARGRRWLLDHQQRIKPPCFGAFSSLGHWNVRHPDEAIGDAERWLFVPTGTRDKPVTAGSIVVNGRLSLTLTIHPDVSSEAAFAERFVERWVEGLQRIAPPT